MGGMGSESPPTLKFRRPFRRAKAGSRTTAQLLLVKSKQKVTNKSKSFRRVTSDTPPLKSNVSEVTSLDTRQGSFSLEDNFTW